VWGDDLFRYDHSGARSFNTSLSTQAFYSIDGGHTDLAEFNQSQNGDFSDWFSTAAHTPRVQDAFASPGATPNLGVELTRLNVLGYKPAVLVAPVVTAAANQTGIAGGSKSFDLGSFTQTSPRGPWRVTVSWGDGSPNTSFFVNSVGRIGAKAHTYASQGAFSPKVTVIDYTNRSSSKTFTINVTHAATIPPSNSAAQLFDTALSVNVRTASSVGPDPSSNGDLLRSSVSPQQGIDDAWTSTSSQFNADSTTGARPAHRILVSPTLNPDAPDADLLFVWPA
jgi:PKD domain